MGSCPPGVTRITSKDLVIRYQPTCYPNIEAESGPASYGVERPTIVRLTIVGGAVGGFKLRVNGRPTGELAYNISDTSLDTALEALESVGASGVTVVESPTDVFTITSAADKFWLVELFDVTTDAEVTLEYVQFGSEIIDLTSDMSNFNYSGTQETTDVTGINEKSRTHLPTVTDMTFDAMLYEAEQDYRHVLVEGSSGYITVYETGIGTGKRYFSFNALLLDVGSSMEAFEKVEIEISGRRQGDYIVRPGSYQGVVGVAPTAGFTFLPSDPEAAESIAFTNTSTNETDWLWDFGDGNLSTAENPSHAYAADGIYTVKLTVTNAFGFDVFEDDVTVDTP